MAPVASEVLLKNVKATRAFEATQTAPLLEIWQGAQDRL